MSASSQPWLANPEWRNKAVRGTTTSDPATSRTTGIWLTGIFALVVGAAGLTLKGQDFWTHSNFSGAILLIFPAVAIAFFWWAVVLGVRARKFGKTVFEMASVPFSPGQNLRGSIHATGLAGGEPIRLRLNCIRRTKFRSHIQGVSSGGSKITFDQLVWRDEKSVNWQAQSSDDRGSVIPVDFFIPPDAPTTNPSNEDDRILWNLEARARMRGVDFVQNFEVPVFCAQGGPIRPAYQATDVNRYAPIPVSLPYHPLSTDRQVTIRTSDSGGTEFLFAASRHWGIAWAATAVFCGWTAIIMYLLWRSDPLALSLFLFADLLLLYWAVWSWFSQSSAIFGGEGVAIRTSLFGIGRSKYLPYDDICDITAPITRQSGQGSQAVPFYAICLATRSQGTITVAGSLRDAAEAVLVVSKMKQTMGKLHLSQAAH